MKYPTNLGASPNVWRTVIRRRVAGVALALAVAAGACGSSDVAAPPTGPPPTETPTPEGDTPIDDDSLDPSLSSGTAAPGVAAPTGPVLASVTFPEIATVATSTIADQAQRSQLGGADTYFWPDGNIGQLDLGDGTSRFFAANGPRIAQTLGTALDPTGELVVASQEVLNVSDEFDYAAGGPVYLDPQSGTLLLWYHAERHLAGDAANFHAAIGLARSNDMGATFDDLGIIIETNRPPDPFSPCCADVGGSPVIVRDGQFHLWFRDRVGADTIVDIQLARASASVDEVVAAAILGELAPWTKYDGGAAMPGLGGTSSALEAGNPRTSWFDVAWNEELQRYLMVIAVHGLLADPSELVLISSPDGIEWTPRQQLFACDCELTYPSFLGTGGPERRVGNRLDIVAVSTAPTADFRWQDTSLLTITVDLTGELVTSASTWTFDDATVGGEVAWEAGGDAAVSISEGALEVTASAADPFVVTTGLGLSAADYDTIQIRMTTDAVGVGQVFFTTEADPGIDEQRSRRFDVEQPGVSVMYEIELGDIEGWSGRIDTLRIDPIDQPGTTRIEEIILVPAP